MRAGGELESLVYIESEKHKQLLNVINVLSSRDIHRIEINLVNNECFVFVWIMAFDVMPRSIQSLIWNFWKRDIVDDDFSIFLIRNTIQSVSLMQLVNKSTIGSKWNVFKNQKKTLQTILFTTFNQPLKVLFHKTSFVVFLSKNHSNVIFMVEVAYGSRVKSSWIKKNNLKIQVFFNSWTLFHSWICGSNCRYTG